MSDLNKEATLDMFSMKGKVALVTGGAGGLGEATCEALAIYGCDIALTGRTMASLERVVAKLEKLGVRAHAVACDCTKEEDVIKMVAEVKEKFGKIDIMCTIAGVARRHPSLDFPADDFNLVINTNILGTFLPCMHVGRLMKEQGYGKIMLVSSVRAYAGHELGYAAYASSKGAINSLTKQLAVEWAPFGIRVNAIAPTVFVTPLTAEIANNPTNSAYFINHIPMRRFALPEDIIGTVVYLCSPASDFITGQIVYTDGGATAY
jgi:NAD(P)-dependent dehydrogenase (short-subunit alcohol dehydrogenase family)